MHQLRKILEDYRGQGSVDGGQILLPPASALHFVDDLAQSGTPILGVARFELVNGQAVQRYPYGFVEAVPGDVTAAARAAREIISGWETGDKADLVAVHFDYSELARPLERRFLPPLQEVQGRTDLVRKGALKRNRWAETAYH